MWSYVVRNLSELRPAYHPYRGQETRQVFDLEALAGKLDWSIAATPGSSPLEPHGARRSPHRAWEPSPSSLLS
jgi:hypothetical protein